MSMEDFNSDELHPKRSAVVLVTVQVLKHMALIFSLLVPRKVLA